jgi:quercetin dioxygenase-like cupin family protein
MYPPSPVLQVQSVNDQVACHTIFARIREPDLVALQILNTTSIRIFMKVIHYSAIPSSSFNSDTVKNVQGRVAIGKDDGAPNFCMRLFTIGPEGHTPRHSHAWEHEIFIHAGKGQVYHEGRWTDVTTGTVIFIPGNEEHQLRNHGSDDFTFLCLIPQGVDEI